VLAVEAISVKACTEVGRIKNGNVRTELGTLALSQKVQENRDK
jgi:hypothetical protein